MNKTTYRLVRSFYLGYPDRIRNTTVSVTKWDRFVRLYHDGYKIAYRSLGSPHILSVSCGLYPTVSTFTRLNGLLNYYELPYQYNKIKLLDSKQKVIVNNVLSKWIEFDIVDKTILNVS